VTGLSRVFEWTGPSPDPNDEQFGDVIESADLDAAGEYTAVLVGEPYDGAVIGRRGAREGPRALREALAATKTHHVDAGPVDSVADLGDVQVPLAADPADEGADGYGGDVAAVQSAVASVTSAVHDAAAVPVFLGGDNSLTVPNARPLVERGSLGVLSFDAHLDCRELGDGPTSGTPYRQLFAAGLESLAVVGARHFETSTAYHDYLHDEGGRVLTAEQVAVDPIDALDDAIASLGDCEAIYVSLDLDVLDAAAAPGVSAPTPGGLSTRELFRMLAHVAADDRVAGFEVVECAPPLDTGDRTARAGSRAVAHFLASLEGAS
jgi:formimidoylglutamase